MVWHFSCTLQRKLRLLSVTIRRRFPSWSVWLNQTVAISLNCILLGFLSASRSWFISVTLPFPLSFGFGWDPWGGGAACRQWKLELKSQRLKFHSRYFLRYVAYKCFCPLHVRVQCPNGWHSYWLLATNFIWSTVIFHPKAAWNGVFVAIKNCFLIPFSVLANLWA